MGNVLQLATGESRVYTQGGCSNPHYSEKLTPAMGLFQDDIKGSRTDSSGRYKRMGLFFKREDGTYYHGQWTIPVRNRIVQCYRAVKLLEYVSIIQEDTLWAAYFLCGRDSTAEDNICTKDSIDKTVARCAKAIESSGIKNPLELRQQLLNDVKIDSDELTRMIESIMASDVLIDVNELQKEIELGTIEKSPAIEDLSIKFIDDEARLLGL
ncbi:hypothetical protein IKW75_02210 [Candidatus Saccharibacteria bacterium]|nr:hypothetical protein [Candidatus Saccharibacteria bacterium]